MAALRNGFIQAIYPALDHEVTIGTEKAVDAKGEKKIGFFRKIFGKPAPEKKETRD